MANVDRFTPYTIDYKRRVFDIWYSLNRPTLSGLESYLLDNRIADEYGRMPSSAVIARWKDEDDWILRADVLDAEVDQTLDKKLVEERIEMMDRQAKIGIELQEMGLEKIRSEGFDNSASALRAILSGAELERESKGLKTALVNVLSKTDEEISDELRKLLERVSGKEIVDAELLEEGEEDGDKQTAD